jgi:2,3-dihydroxybenzoate-AMP ligase
VAPRTLSNARPGIAHAMSAPGPRIALEGVVYPPASVLRRYSDAGLIGHETLWRALVRSFRNNAQRIALRGPEGVLTYAELDDLTERLAVALRRLGLRAMDRVLFQLPNSNELVALVTACWRARLIPVCTLAAHRDAEIGYLAALSGAKAMIVPGDDAKFDFLAFAQSMAAKAPSIAHIIVARDTDSRHPCRFDVLAQTKPTAKERAELEALEDDPYQVCAFQLSGGTTDVPKIIPRFSSEYLYNMRAVAACLAWSANDVVLMPLPMMHNANMGCGWGPALLTGATTVVTPQISPEVFVQVMGEDRPTWLAVAKPILTRLAVAVQKGLINFSQVRGVISTDGAALVRELLGAPGYHIFGMTEGVIMLTREGDPDEALRDSVGKPVSAHDEIQLLRPGTNEAVPAGEIGELAVRGPYTIHGYYKSPERNAVAFTPDGRYRSGDLMSARVIDGRTFYFFEGRLKDVIDRANEKINCEEVERALKAHPGVLDAALVAMPDPEYGERACAFVIPAIPDATPALDDIRAHLRGIGLAKFKWPERLEVVDAFPVTKVGKLDKAALRETIRQMLQGERP